MNKDVLNGYKNDLRHGKSFGYSEFLKKIMDVYIGTEIN